MNENWKDIPGYEGMYQVSDLGRVKSLERKVIKSNGTPYNVVERIRKLSYDKDGYNVVNLLNNGDRKKHRVSVLVAICFLNHTPNGNTIVVDHINKDITNNSLDNLQLITQRLNLSKDKINKSSKYTGVYFDKKCKNWRASIFKNGKTFNLGNFKTEYEAHLTYKKNKEE